MIGSKRRIVKLLIFSFVFFSAGMQRVRAADDASVPRTVQEEKTVITIEHSQSTSYEKNKETGNDTIVLSGAVRISVAKGNTKTTIRAERITYDRKTQMMYASGGVMKILIGI